MSERTAHFAPLAVFAALTIASAGLTAGAAASGLAPGAAGAPEPSVLLVALTAQLLAGAAASAHLGRKRRAFLALGNLVRSWLSREVLLAAAYTALLAAAVFLVRAASPLAEPALLAAAALGLCTTVAIGLVFRLPVQRTWNGIAAVAAPLAGALTLAALWAAGTSAGGSSARLGAFLLLLLDAVLATARFRGFAAARRMRHSLTHADLAPAAAFLHALRRGLGIASVLLLLGSAPRLSFLAFALNVVADRFAFFAGAAKETPAAGIAALRAERLRAAARPDERS